MSEWAAFGMPRERIARMTSEDLGIWPDNELPVLVFAAMQTQWRVGMAGPTGLDYAALPAVEARVGVRKKQRPEVFRALRVMEWAALAVFAERRG